MSKKLATAVMATIIGAGTTATLSAQAAPAMVKCYGVAKAGKNDCGTPKHACAGQATQNGDPQEWIMVPKGVCKNLVGGSPNKPGGGLSAACKKTK